VFVINHSSLLWADVSQNSWSDNSTSLRACFRLLHHAVHITSRRAKGGHSWRAFAPLLVNLLHWVFRSPPIPCDGYMALMRLSWRQRMSPSDFPSEKKSQRTPVRADLRPQRPLPILHLRQCVLEAGNRSLFSVQRHTSPMDGESCMLTWNIDESHEKNRFPARDGLDDREPPVRERVRTFLVASNKQFGFVVKRKKSKKPYRPQLPLIGQTPPMPRHELAHDHGSGYLSVGSAWPGEGGRNSWSTIRCRTSPSKRLGRMRNTPATIVTVLL